MESQRRRRVRIATAEYPNGSCKVAHAPSSVPPAVVLDIDSGGDTVPGTPQCFQAIIDLRTQKKVVACVNATAGSAAYWIPRPPTPSGSPCTARLRPSASSPSTRICPRRWRWRASNPGSSAPGGTRPEDSPLGPLCDEAKAAIQAQVDATYGIFVLDVARGRGINPSAVKSGFGEGRMVYTKDAVAAGMADKIGTLNECLASLVGKPSAGSRQAAHAAPAVQVVQAADKVEVTVGDGESKTTSETVAVVIEEPQMTVAAKDDLEVRRRRQRILSH